MEDPTITRTHQTLQVEEQEHTLPDESDQIISELRHELQQLKSQVLGQPSTPESNLQIRLQIRRQQVASLEHKQQSQQQQSELMPQVVQKLKSPIEELQQNLGQLMSHVQDPAVQETLKHCQNMALAAIQQTQKVQEQTEQLQAEVPLDNRHKVDVLSFFKELAVSSSTEERSVRLFAGQQLPKSLNVDEELFQKAILTLLKEIHRLSQDEDPIKITLKQGQSMLYDINVEHLEVGLLGSTAWDLPPNEELRALLKNAVEESESLGLDLLYAKKIIEDHGGQVLIHKESDRICGFDLKVPTIQ